MPGMLLMSPLLSLFGPLPLFGASSTGYVSLFREDIGSANNPKLEEDEEVSSLAGQDDTSKNQMEDGNPLESPSDVGQIELGDNQIGGGDTSGWPTAGDQIEVSDNHRAWELDTAEAIGADN